MRFDLGDLGRIDTTQARHFVLGGSLLQVVETAHLRLVDSHNQLPAFLKCDTTLSAVLTQQGAAPGAQLRLQRTRLVVDARMDHSRVVPGLVYRQPVFLLEDDHLDARITPRQLPTHRQPENPAPDDTHRQIVDRLVHRESAVASAQWPGPSAPAWPGPGGLSTSIQLSIQLPEPVTNLSTSGVNMRTPPVGQRATPAKSMGDQPTAASSSSAKPLPQYSMASSYFSTRSPPRWDRGRMCPTG